MAISAQPLLIGVDVSKATLAISGQLRGKRRLTKKGNPELRRLLFLAAMQAARSRSWKDFYQKQLGRGFSRVQALVILARKLQGWLSHCSRTRPSTDQDT